MKIKINPRLFSQLEHDLIWRRSATVRKHFANWYVFYQKDDWICYLEKYGKWSLSDAHMFSTQDDALVALEKANIPPFIAHK